MNTIVEAKLPNLDDLYAVADDVAKLKAELAFEKIRLDILLAQITRKVTEDESFWVAGKPPSMRYIETNYHVLGFDNQTGDLIESIRKNIVALESKIGLLTNRFNIMRDQIDIWRTHSANLRTSVQ